MNTNENTTPIAKRQRGKGRGTLVKRGNNYYARWVVAGKVYTKALKTTVRREAEIKMAEIMKVVVARDEAASLANAIVRMEGVQAQIAKYEDERPALPLAEAFGVFASKAAKTSPATMAMYSGQLARLVQWVKDNEPHCVEMRHFTQEMAERFMADIAREFSANTYNKYLSFMRLLWRKLVRESRAKSDPWAEFERRPISKNNGRRALSAQELAAVCALLEGEMLILFALGLYTGLRLGDCAMLKWESVDLSRGILHTIPRKTAKAGRIVTVSIHPVLHKLLSETPRTVGSPYVMPSIAEQYQRDDSSLVGKIQEVFAKAGIKTQDNVDGYSRKVTIVGFHSLRHTFVSLCGNGGIPLAYVQSIVGHESPMMTSHYFHADVESHRGEIAAALPNILENGANLGGFKPINGTRAGNGTGYSPQPCDNQPQYAQVLAMARKLPPASRKRLIAALSA